MRTTNSMAMAAAAVSSALQAAIVKSPPMKPTRRVSFADEASLCTMHFFERPGGRSDDSEAERLDFENTPLMMALRAGLHQLPAPVYDAGISDILSIRVCACTTRYSFICTKTFAFGLYYYDLCVGTIRGGGGGHRSLTVCYRYEFTVCLCASPLPICTACIFCNCRPPQIASAVYVRVRRTMCAWRYRLRTKIA